MKNKYTILFKEFDDSRFSRITTYDLNTAYHFLNILMCDEWLEHLKVYYNNELVKNDIEFIIELEKKVKLRK